MAENNRPVGEGVSGPAAPLIHKNFRAGLALLWQACWYARDAGADLWDFALEIDRLYQTGLTISDLRWLVAKGFAEHGQESSVCGSPHRSFCRGAGFSFDRTTCVVLTPRGAAFVDQSLKASVGSAGSVLPLATPSLAGGETPALAAGLPEHNGHKRTIPVTSRPCWDSSRRELTLRGTVVKRYRVPAQNQERILATFEEEGWPDHIDDPL